MFDLTSSKLLILGVVALIVVGPKELPFLLRTIGKYVAMIRRQANEFRAQFDEAMREAELESIKTDIETVARDAETSLRDVQTSVERDMAATEHAVNQSVTVAPTQAPSDHTPTASAPEHSFDPLNGLDTGVVTPSAETVHVAPTDHSNAMAPPDLLVPVHSPDPVLERGHDLARELAKTGT